MTEQQQTEGQAPEAEGQAPASQDGDGQAPEPQQPTQQQPQSIEDLPTWVQKEIKDLRKENANARKERQQREQAEQTELQRVQGELEEARTANERKTARIRRANFIESVGVPNARWAWAAAQDAGIEVQFSEDDAPTNLDAVRKELVKADPKLFGSGNADAGERGEPAKTTGPAESLAGMLLNRG